MATRRAATKTVATTENTTKETAPVKSLNRTNLLNVVL